MSDKYPNQYLLIKESATETETIYPFRANCILDIQRLVKKWVKEQFCGEMKAVGFGKAGWGGQFIAEIKLNGEPPSSITVWESCSFRLESTY